MPQRKLAHDRHPVGPPAAHSRGHPLLAVQLSRLLSIQYHIAAKKKKKEKGDSLLIHLFSLPVILTLLHGDPGGLKSEKIGE
jgi:hypothetical protein